MLFFVKNKFRAGVGRRKNLLYMEERIICLNYQLAGMTLTQNSNLLESKFIQNPIRNICC